jgi:hypothetical protein
MLTFFSRTVGRMPRYNFNFVGEKSVDNFFTDAFESDAQAKEYASRLAVSFQRRMPDVCNGSYIALLRGSTEIAQFFLSTTH